MVQNVSINEEKSEAAWYYHHPAYGYNCAQAMVHHFGGSTKEIKSMQTMGGGQAPNGYCGALHAALYLLKEKPEAQQKIINDFAEKTGSPYCRQIRKEKQVTCRECVRIADRNLKILRYNDRNDR